MSVKNQFTCRVCGHHDYVPKKRFVHLSTPVIGGRQIGHDVVTGYACSGCSVMFDDPKKFGGDQGGG